MKRLINVLPVLCLVTLMGFVSLAVSGVGNFATLEQTPFAAALSRDSLAWADEASTVENSEDAIEAEIAVDPVVAEATNPDQPAKDKKVADDIDNSSTEDPMTTTETASSGQQTDVSTDFGLPADSPLFSGIEEDVEVSSSSNADSSAEDTTSSESSGDEVDEVTAPADDNGDVVTLVPDDDWLARGNAVLPLQLPDSSFIYDTSIQELSNADPYLDNQTVQVTGEAIGESIRASLFGRARWVTLSPVGESVTVSVFMTEESAAKIDSFGRYGVRGSILKVRGTFYLVCPEHDGATDLHAEEVTVVKPGESVHESFSIFAFAPGMILVVVGLIMLFIFTRVSERRR